MIYAANFCQCAFSYVLIWKEIVDPSYHELLVEQISFWIASFLIVETAFFVLYQKRELSQFFLIQDLKKKQVQMTNVFNAQDDAVVVVQQDQSYKIEAQELKIEESQQDVPSFLFSNRKSIELFGSDL